MKLPRLPRKCSVLEAKYSTEQMREYAHKAIREYLNESYKRIEDDIKKLNDVPVLTDVVKQKSIIDKIKESWT